MARPRWGRAVQIASPPGRPGSIQAQAATGGGAKSADGARHQSVRSTVTADLVRVRSGPHPGAVLGSAEATANAVVPTGRRPRRHKLPSMGGKSADGARHQTIRSTGTVHLRLARSEACPEAVLDSAEATVKYVLPTGRRPRRHNRWLRVPPESATSRHHRAGGRSPAAQYCLLTRSEARKPQTRRNRRSDRLVARPVR